MITMGQGCAVCRLGQLNGCNTGFEHPRVWSAEFNPVLRSNSIIRTLSNGRDDDTAPSRYFEHVFDSGKEPHLVCLRVSTAHDASMLATARNTSHTADR